MPMHIILTSKLNYVDSTVSINGGGRKFIGDILHSIEIQSPSVEAYNTSANDFTGFSKHILNSDPFDLNMSGHGYKWWKGMLGVLIHREMPKESRKLLIQLSFTTDILF